MILELFKYRKSKIKYKKNPSAEVWPIFLQIFLGN